jgi:hypothetical protein
MRINWRDPVWYLDLLSADLTPVALALPLVTGADLLAQYAYLNLGFCWWSVLISPDRKTPQKPISVSPVISTLSRSKHVTELDASFRTVAA